MRGIVDYFGQQLRTGLAPEKKGPYICAQGGRGSTADGRQRPRVPQLGFNLLLDGGDPMATTTVVDGGSVDLDALEQRHIHIDPAPWLPNFSVVQVTAYPIYSGSNPDTIGSVIRVENIKMQLADPLSFSTPWYRLHFDLINESNTKVTVQVFVLVAQNP
jgi:hypothetical protein